MSTYFAIIVDADVTIDGAEQVKESVLALFREKGLIAGLAEDDSAEGGESYRPGPACHELYKPAEAEHEFWKMTGSNVEPRLGRDFNHFGPLVLRSMVPLARYAERNSRLTTRKYMDFSSMQLWNR